MTRVGRTTSRDFETPENTAQEAQQEGAKGGKGAKGKGDKGDPNFAAEIQVPGEGDDDLQPPTRAPITDEILISTIH